MKYWAAKTAKVKFLYSSHFSYFDFKLCIQLSENNSLRDLPEILLPVGYTTNDHGTFKYITTGGGMDGWQWTFE